MKKFLMSAIAATLIAAPVMATAADAQAYRQTERTVTTVKQKPNGRTVVKQRTVARQPQARVVYRTGWRKGERFNRLQARNYRVIDYRQYRGLRAPPRGYRYVQSGNDAVLVGITSGIVAAVLSGVIR
ncbi:hypothetical protein ASE75_05615 [Sphingomonas sp. Leaf17]|uniref:RcnB family protein n=1 Tax=Sphingomonas sp. Leaf17 TaxID=1735683 RepID=UPI0006F4BD73|nr:RcnB family protein [Sphingomonas sp. Leaf17]KQM65713.1 hypothetical protein ASE75_05615 [Sphingomonas sp. Leaf17]